MSAMPPQPPTRSGPIPEARHVVLPKGIVSSGFPRVRETCRQIGIEFDPWQRGLNRCILAKTADGLFAADTVALSIARQVGKTFDVGALTFAECIAVPGTTAVWTAHRFKVSRESFNELRALAKSPKLTPHIEYDDITTAAGNETIPFRNGSRIVFAARERGAIRGFTKVRILVLDEAQILTEAALSDLAPTMNQAANPLIILMGTPPKPSDPSEVFSNLRSEALMGTSEGVLYVEISGDPALGLDDRENWRQANPSYPSRTPARSILRLRKLLADDDFRREALGIWDSDAARTVIPASLWDELADTSPMPPRPVGRVAFAVDSSPDNAWTSISVAGVRADGLRQVQVVEHRPGQAWAVDRLAELARAHASCAVVVDPRSTAGALTADLAAKGVEAVLMSSQDVAQACTQFYNAAVERQLRHLGQLELTDALMGATKRELEASWAWNRKNLTIDLTPLVSATNALWGWTTRHASGDILQAVW